MLGVVSGMALIGALAGVPAGTQLDQALVAVEVMHDGQVQFGQGVVAARGKPGRIEFLHQAGHMVMSCNGGVSMTSKALPEGYVLLATLVGDRLDVQLDRHVPRHFDDQFAKLKKGQCMELMPSDQVVFSGRTTVPADTHGQVKQVDLGQGYVLRYNSHLDLADANP